MEYLEIIKEFISAFPYWKQSALIVSGIVCIDIFFAIRNIRRNRRFTAEIARRGIVVIESKKSKKRKSDDVNTRYFEYIKNAQYATVDLPKDFKLRVNRIEK